MEATQKSSKKRPASVQSGPALKKAHLAKPAKGKLDAAPEKKRSRPVTRPVQDENSEDEDEFDDLDGAEDGAVFDEVVVDNGIVTDASNAPPKDPNGTSVLSGIL
jgi:hypothetical protein